MALIPCPECKKNISESAVNCPNCGYQLTSEKIAEIKQKEPQVQKGCSSGCLSVIAISVISVTFLSVVGLITQSNSPSSRSSTSSSHEVVENSAWDASVSQVESWLKANLKDPGSLECIEWSPVSKTNDGGFTVRVKYRAKNSFGGYVVANKVFFLNSAGSVTNSMDY
jgi:zinc-ribbon domain